jgi:hypothetical protein
MFRERMTRGGDFIHQAQPFYAAKVEPHLDDLLPKDWTRDQAIAVLEVVQQTLKRQVADDQPWQAEALEALLKRVMAERATVAEDADETAKAAAGLWQPKGVFGLMRAAVTGRRDAPPLFAVLAALGNIVVLERLGLAAQRLQQRG